MHVYSVEDLAENREEIAERLRSGQIAIFPTDTIYGLTADARNLQAVETILDIKRRRSPVSCIPHNILWAKQLVSEDAQDHFEILFSKHAGPFTMLWPVSQQDPILHPCVQTEELIGMRCPNHWITEFADWAQLPLTTTSVNRTSGSPMTCLDNLDPEIAMEVDFCLNAGLLTGRASTILRYQNGQMEEIRKR